jgi:hypothetical protein
VNLKRYQDFKIQINRKAYRFDALYFFLIFKKLFPMKGMKFLALAIGVLTIVSCRKESMQQEAVNTEVPAADVSTTTSSARLSAWQQVNSWSAAKQSGSVYTGRIDDVAITTEITNTGMVLLFSKNGATTQSLPFKQDDNTYWSYQVEEGSVIVNADAGVSKTTMDNNRQFQYIVLSKEQLDALEAKGYSRSSLINISYQSASTLFQ